MWLLGIYFLVRFTIYVFAGVAVLFFYTILFSVYVIAALGAVVYILVYRLLKGEWPSGEGWVADWRRAPTLSRPRSRPRKKIECPSCGTILDGPRVLCSRCAYNFALAE